MVDALVEQISEESGKDEEEIRERIEDKMKEMSGLVSEEGAAHLIAKEEGVELAEAVEKELKVENIVPGMRRVDVKGKVVDITDMNTFERDDGEDGKVQNIVLGDDTGTIRMSLWDEQTEVTEKVDIGDSIHISGAYSREDNRGNAELRIGNETQMEMLDEDIGEVKQESPSSSGGGQHERVNIREVMDENRNYEVVGTVVELYTDNPFYKACPECNKKVQEEDGEYECEEHGEVDIQYNLILSAIVDDGYGNIRTVFFRDRAKELLDAEDEEFNGNTEKVQEYGEKVQGRDVQVQGRARYNDFFNRIELIGNDISFVNEQALLTQKLEAINE
jgi:replication factor A1